MPPNSERSFEPKPIEERERFPTGEEIWNEMSGEVRTEIEDLYQQYEFDPEFTDETERKEKIEILTAREAQFVVRIWDELRHFSQDNPYRINLLFDIDETLGRFKPDETGNDGQTVMRPASLRLIDQLQQKYSEKLHIGFITTRGEQYLEGQLNDPRHLLPLNNVVDRSLLFSTSRLAHDIDWDNPEDVAFYQATRQSGDVAHTAKYAENIIDPEQFAQAAESNYWSLFRHTGDKLKTSLLARLVRQYSDQAFMAVDDFPYPSILRKDSPHIRGVWLDQEAAFYL